MLIPAEKPCISAKIWYNGLHNSRHCNTEYRGNHKPCPTSRRIAFRASYFEFRACFGFRASDLGFPPIHRAVLCETNPIPPGQQPIAKSQQLFLRNEPNLCPANMRNQPNCCPTATHQRPKNAKRTQFTAPPPSCRPTTNNELLYAKRTQSPYGHGPGAPGCPKYAKNKPNPHTAAILPPPIPRNKPNPSTAATLLALPPHPNAQNEPNSPKPTANRQTPNAKKFKTNPILTNQIEP